MTFSHFKHPDLFILIYFPLSLILLISNIVKIKSNLQNTIYDTFPYSNWLKKSLQTKRGVKIYSYFFDVFAAPSPPSSIQRQLYHLTFSHGLSNPLVLNLLRNPLPFLPFTFSKYQTALPYLSPLVLKIITGEPHVHHWLLEAESSDFQQRCYLSKSPEFGASSLEHLRWDCYRNWDGDRSRRRCLLFVLVKDGFLFKTEISKVQTQNTYYDPLQSQWWWKTFSTQFPVQKSPGLCKNLQD